MKRPCEMTPEERRDHCNKMAKLWRQKNPEKMKAIYTKRKLYQESWAKKNKVRMDFLQKRWRENHRERVNENARNWSRANPTKVHVRFKKWREDNLEYNKERWAKYYTDNRAALSAKRLEFRRKNKERLQSERKIRYQKIKHDPVYVANNRAVQHRRKARVRQAKVGSPSAIRKFVSKVYASNRVRCYYCRKYFRGSKAHIDHVIPISKGGAHEVGNLCCSCPTCNQSKCAKLPSQFVVSGQAMLSL